MRVFHSIDEVPKLDRKSAVAIGNFDGVHAGHKALLTLLLAKAQARNLIPSVLTFYPHPIEVLKPGAKLERLTTTAEKLALLEDQGIEHVLVETFDKTLAAMGTRQFFAKYLVNNLFAHSVHVGYNFMFGKNREGGPDMLKTLCDEFGVEFELFSPFCVNGEQVSSSRIRETIGQGDVRKSALLLGRPYAVTGQVVHGQTLGTQVGFPTANLRYPPDKIMPKNGVYVTEAVWQKQTFVAVTNIGVRPTVHEESTVTVEVHLLDFQKTLYDEFIEVRFIDRIRDEKKFDSLEALTSQIRKDVELVRGSR